MLPTLDMATDVQFIDKFFSMCMEVYKDAVDIKISGTNVINTLDKYGKSKQYIIQLNETRDIQQLTGSHETNGECTAVLLGQENSEAALPVLRNEKDGSSLLGENESESSKFPDELLHTENRPGEDNNPKSCPESVSDIFAPTDDEEEYPVHKNYSNERGHQLSPTIEPTKNTNQQHQKDIDRTIAKSSIEAEEEKNIFESDDGPLTESQDRNDTMPGDDSVTNPQTKANGFNFNAENTDKDKSQTAESNCGEQINLKSNDNNNLGKITTGDGDETCDIFDNSDLEKAGLDTFTCLLNKAISNNPHYNSDDICSNSQIKSMSKQSDHVSKINLETEPNDKDVKDDENEYTIFNILNEFNIKEETNYDGSFPVDLNVSDESSKTLLDHAAVADHVSQNQGTVSTDLDIKEEDTTNADYESDSNSRSLLSAQCYQQQFSDENNDGPIDAAVHNDNGVNLNGQQSNNIMDMESTDSVGLNLEDVNKVEESDVGSDSSSLPDYDITNSQRERLFDISLIEQGHNDDNVSNFESAENDKVKETGNNNRDKKIKKKNNTNAFSTSINPKVIADVNVLKIPEASKKMVRDSVAKMSIIVIDKNSGTFRESGNINFKEEENNHRDTPTSSVSKTINKSNCTGKSNSAVVQKCLENSNTSLVGCYRMSSNGNGIGIGEEKISKMSSPKLNKSVHASSTVNINAKSNSFTKGQSVLKKRSRFGTAKYTRRKPCGKCSKCQVQTDCGTCNFCLTRKTGKQKCLTRMCVELYTGKGKRIESDFNQKKMQPINRNISTLKPQRTEQTLTSKNTRVDHKHGQTLSQHHNHVESPTNNKSINNKSGQGETLTLSLSGENPANRKRHFQESPSRGKSGDNPSTQVHNRKHNLQESPSRGGVKIIRLNDHQSPFRRKATQKDINDSDSDDEFQ